MADVIGFAQINARLLNLIRALPEEIEDAMKSEAEMILEEAKRLCPVDTGDLQDSGMIQPIEKSGHEVKVPITFGDPTPYYAIYVHENLQARHPNGGQAKFLEQPALAAAAGMSSRVAMKIKLDRAMG